MKKNRHLNPEEIAKCADAINKNQFSEIDEKIQFHIQNCDQCAHEIMFISEIAKNIESENIKISNPNFKKVKLFTTKKTIISISIAASLIFGIFYITNFLNTEKETIIYSDKIENIDFDQESKQIIKENPIIKEPISKTKNIKNNNNIETKKFSENNNLELLISKNEGNFRGSDINILNSRTINLKKSNKIEILNPKNEILFIEILDNNESTIIETEIIDNKFIISNLKKGLYYYKIFNYDFDLIFVGKIISE